MVAQILDQYGKPMRFNSQQHDRLMAVRGHYEKKLRLLKASYDATRDGSSFVNHWSNADHLAPNGTSSYQVRRTLRSRSRFEVIENNPYLSGMVLMMANDFTGSGPKLQVTDRRISKASQRFIEEEYQDWKAATKYRRKLWQQRIAKCVDGETFKRAYVSHRIETPVKINYEVIEADLCTSEGIQSANEVELSETDGIRIDRNKEVVQYFLLDEHPGSTLFSKPLTGRWYHARFVTHWFRPTRTWNRGIPETAPSLPLCALLRRYTLASVKAAETNASMTAILESQMPASGSGIDDDAFDTIPIEHDMFTVLPFGYKFSQFQQGAPLPTYDAFVNAILREIARPILVPYNYAAGSSQDSNMATAVVDGHIYKEGGRMERLSCAEEVLDQDFALWWLHARLIPRYLPADCLRLPGPPRQINRWDRIGLDHTDPAKVANSLKIAQEAGHLTDRDIQEGWFNRHLEDWQEDLREQMKFREEVGMSVGYQQQQQSEQKSQREEEEDE